MIFDFHNFAVEMFDPEILNQVTLEQENKSSMSVDDKCWWATDPPGKIWLYKGPKMPAYEHKTDLGLP